MGVVVKSGRQQGHGCCAEVRRGWGGGGGGGGVTFCMDHASGDLVKSMVVTVEVGPSSALVVPGEQ